MLRRKCRAGAGRLWVISTHLSKIEDQLMSAPVRKRRTKSGPGALRLAGLP